MMQELTDLDEWAGALLGQMKPAARRKAAVDIGRELRRSQKARIAAQKDPEGGEFEPRKPRAANLREKEGRIKQRTMFAKLRTARYFKVIANSDEVLVGFAGRAAQLARVHQDGEESEVAQGQSYKYPVRQLLGFTPAEREMIRAKLMDHLTR